MKTYFSSDLKGTKIFLPIFLLVLFFVAYLSFSTLVGLANSDYTTTALYSQQNFSLFSVMTPVNGFYFLQLLVSLGLGICSMLVVYSIQFFIVKYTLGSLSFKGERFDTSEMKFGGFFVRVLGWTALTLITCFIYTPWLVTNLIRYYASRTSYKGKNLRFLGSGSMLFGFAVLCYILPIFAIAIMMVLFGTLIPMTTAYGFYWLVIIIAVLAVAIFCSLFYAFVIRWSLDFEYDGKAVSASSMRYGKMTWFILGQLLLILVTCGLYAPAFMLRLLRYVFRHITMTDDTGKVVCQGGFDFKVSDYWFILGQWILSNITLGIYLPWAYAAVIKRASERTYAEEK